MKTDFIKHISCLMIFGTNGTVSKHINLGSSHIVFFRSLIGWAFMFLSLIFSSHSFVFPKYRKQSLYLAVSGIALGASWLLLFEAYTRINVSIASMLFYCGPVIVMALSPLLFRDRLTIYKVIGFIVVLTGLYLLNGTTIEGEGDISGIVLALLAAVMYAVMVICCKFVKDITGMENSCIQMFFCFITIAVYVFFTQGMNIHVERSSIIPILILGIVNTGIGMYMYFATVNRLPVYTVAICGYTEPLSSVICSVLFLHETLSLSQCAGVAFIIGGAMFAELSDKFIASAKFQKRNQL